MGPSAIRYAGVEERLTGLGYTCVDWGNVETAVLEATAVQDESARYLPEIKAACTHVARLVEVALDDGQLPLVLGGDHSIALGTLGGLARAHGTTGGVLWIDAHADLNTPATSPSGNVHGMPLAAALGMAGELFESNGWTIPAVDRGSGRARGRPLARRRRAAADPRPRRQDLHDERRRPDRDRASGSRVAGPHRRARLRPRLARHGRARSGGRAGSGHSRPRRPLLSRGAPRARARRRVGACRLARGGRGEPDPRSRERDRTARRRARGERSRQDDSLSEPPSSRARRASSRRRRSAPSARRSSATSCPGRGSPRR